MKVLVTGGLGYIGSHTVVQLIQAGYEPVIVDNLSNSEMKTLCHLEEITGKSIPCHCIDLCDRFSLNSLFTLYDFEVVIHFAAFKSVPESVSNPLKYFTNNIESTISLLKAMERNGVNKLVFSSSCSIYGNTSGQVDETTPMGKAQSPYALTKQICEQMISSYFSLKEGKAILLRYFNPVGVHPSLLLGEDKSSPNLVPVVVRNNNVKVFGNDYDTKDGTPLRDYIHVMDVADAHVAAIKRFYVGNNVEIFNLGSGIGSTVLEVIQAFERVSGQKCNYEIVGRRQGDADKIYANTSLALSLLGWKPKYSLDEMVLSYYQYYTKHFPQRSSLSSDVPSKAGETNSTAPQEKQC